MIFTLHQRRVEQEWRLLQMLASMNRPVLEILNRGQEATSEIFCVVLRQTYGLAKQASELKLLETHTVVVHFPEFFPSVPIEVSLLNPVFHPNVHPVNGFVCLWNRFSAGDTVMEAVLRLQRIITWELLNEGGDHVLQPECISWHRDPQRGIKLPLDCQPVRKPEGFLMERTFARRPEGNYRRRLC
jgi:hypothetical protein